MRGCTQVALKLESRLKSCLKLSNLAAIILCAILLLPQGALGQQRARAVAAPSATPKDDGQWLMAAKNYASTRYSVMGQINRQNVRGLQVAFTFSTGLNKGHEAAPLVVGST